MLQAISQALGYTFNPDPNSSAHKHLLRVSGKLRDGVKPDSDSFVGACMMAESDVFMEGERVISSMINPASMASDPVFKVNKIKVSPKGERIKVAAPNGVKFSYGPIWNESVMKAKGIAVVPANRAKLNHQGTLVGVPEPEKLDVKALCAAISVTF